ncbi:MAG TPA: nucleotidyl transferase AbiEii/AbiGii toxin family protein [Thermoplasmata archaeon]
MIGGYAVCAYGPPRYSVDVDVVIPYASARAIRSWLRERGLRLEAHSTPDPQNYEGQVERYSAGGVTLDLLAGAVRDRDAQVDLPETWISLRPRKIRLQTVAARSIVEIPVVRPGALWALKLQSGRDSDLSDLFAIAEEPVDTGEVRQLFLQLRSRLLVAKLRNVRKKLDEERLFVDSLSRRELGRPSDPSNRRKWSLFVAKIDRILGTELV